MTIPSEPGRVRDAHTSTNQLAWWLRIVGTVYLLTGLGFVPPVHARVISTLHPGVDAPNTGVAYRGLLDVSFLFGLDLIVIGAYAIWTSRNPLRHRSIVWLIVWLELIRGIFDDIYMLARGYNAAFMIGFIVAHLIIIGTGVAIVNNTRRERPA